MPAKFKRDMSTSTSSQSNDVKVTATSFHIDVGFSSILDANNNNCGENGCVPVNLMEPHIRYSWRGTLHAIDAQMPDNNAAQIDFHSSDGATVVKHVSGNVAVLLKTPNQLADSVESRKYTSEYTVAKRFERDKNRFANLSFSDNSAIYCSKYANECTCAANEQIHKCQCLETGTAYLPLWAAHSNMRLKRMHRTDERRCFLKCWKL